MTPAAEGLYPWPLSGGYRGLSSNSLLVLTSCGGPAEAQALADALVGMRLAACVNVVTGVSSVYRWQGEVERGEEVLVLIKTTAERFEALKRAIESRSSYELPEVLAVSVTSGSAPFLEWIAANVGE